MVIPTRFERVTPGLGNPWYSEFGGTSRVLVEP